MKLSRVALLVGIVVLGIGAGTGCGSKDPVLAKVGDREIRASDYTESYLKVKPEVRPALTTGEERKAFLDDLINKEVMEILAYEKYPQPLQRLQTRLTRFVDGQLTDKAVNRLIRDQLKVTKEMKDTIYKDMRRELHIKAMLIPDRDAAEYVSRKRQEGEDLSTLARDHSTEWPGTGEHGDLGWVSPGMFPYPVDKAVWEAEVGSVVGPIERSRGNYIVKVLEERPKPVTSTREDLEELLHQTIMEQLYMERTKFVQDSLKAAVKTYYPADGKALIMMKYYWEIPEDQVDNPYAKLDAHRVIPTFTAEEESVIVVDFTGVRDWTAREFVDRLAWYPMGIWPTGASEEELVDQLDIMVRDYLYIKAATDLGLRNEAFETAVQDRLRQMRVNYFYFQDLSPRFAPDSTEIYEFYQANRDRYRAPQSYKMSFFGSPYKDLIEDIARRWKEGASFLEIREHYADKGDDELIGVGETEWLYDGQDALRDEMIAPLREGGVSDVVVRTDVAMVVKLIARRPPRVYTYAEVRDTVEKDANTMITDQKLKAFLNEKRNEMGVTIHEDLLQKIKVPEADAPWANPDQLPAVG